MLNKLKTCLGNGKSGSKDQLFFLTRLFYLLPGWLPSSLAPSAIIAMHKCALVRERKIAATGTDVTRVVTYLKCVHFSARLGSETRISCIIEAVFFHVSHIVHYSL